jgi:ubiquinol-cytochrome c reductase cytochrome b subunit
VSTDTSKVAASNGTEAAAPAGKPTKAGAAANWADERLGIGGLSKFLSRKIFPDHWSFMLGEIALWSFVVLLVTGTFLTLCFKPSMAEIRQRDPVAMQRGEPRRHRAPLRRRELPRGPRHLRDLRARLAHRRRSRA